MSSPELVGELTSPESSRKLPAGSSVLARKESVSVLENAPRTDVLSETDTKVNATASTWDTCNTRPSMAIAGIDALPNAWMRGWTAAWSSSPLRNEKLKLAVREAGSTASVMNTMSETSKSKSPARFANKPASGPDSCNEP
eukprot:1365347-Rhodomonas_salina.1